MVNESILNDHEFIALKGWCHPFSFILKDCSESLVLGVTVLHAFLITQSAFICSVTYSNISITI